MAHFKLSSFADTISHSLADSLNPVLVKDIRESLRSRSLYYCTVLVIFLQVLLFVLNHWSVRDNDSVNTILRFYLMIYLFCAYVPILSLSQNWRKERCSDALALEHTTPLTPWQIISGRIQAFGVLWFTLLVVGMPLPAYLICQEPVTVFSIINSLFMFTAIFFGISFFVNTGGKRTELLNILSVFIFLIAGSHIINAFVSGRNFARAYQWISEPLIVIYFSVLCILLAILYGAGGFKPIRSNRYWIPHFALFLAFLSVPFALSFFVFHSVITVETASGWGGVFLTIYGVIVVSFATLANVRITERCRLDRPKNPLLRIIYWLCGPSAVARYSFGMLLMLAGCAIVCYGQGVITENGLNYDKFNDRGLLFLPSLVMCAWCYSCLTRGICSIFRQKPLSVLFSIIAFTQVINVFSSIVDGDAKIFSLFSPFASLFFDAYELIIWQGSFSLIMSLWLIYTLRHESRRQ
ncbi:MAG: hypothetical protein WC198_06445 [Victivallaceae bacterium]